MKPTPNWPSSQLELSRQQSVDLFRSERLEEPLEAYGQAFDQYRDAVDTLIESTQDLAKLREQAKSVLADGLNREIVRYLAGPPISNDDLKTLVGQAVNAKQIKANPSLATTVIDLIMDGLDQRRFPWVRDGREPTEAERLAAVIASSALLANRRVATERRHRGKEQQELAVCQVLESIGWQQVSRRQFKTVDDAPTPGEFCRECIVGNKKADILVRLRDRRLMPIECKVSNSQVNSIKRLGEAEGKARLWTKAFGDSWVVPAAVLSGVFGLKDLVVAQERGLSLFWGHDLAALSEWVESAIVEKPKSKPTRGRGPRSS